MEDKEIEKFSWTAFFIVTGICSFGFSKILYYLDGTRLPIFNWIGIIAIVIGLLNSIRNLVIKTDKQ